MKTSNRILSANHAEVVKVGRPRDERAVALIIVLAMLLLLSGLIVSFMTTVSNERAATTASSAVGATRQIADSTLNLVLAQIREGTSQSGDGVAWASQPGAIRTFTGKLEASPISLPRGAYAFPYRGTSDVVYKLYSADKMKVSASEFADDVKPGKNSNEVGVIENWDRLDPKHHYTDLNEPILSRRADLSSGTREVVEPRYPIVDPRAKFNAAENPPNQSANFGIVEGFDARTSNNSTFQDQSLFTPASNPVPYLPMPVKWLYVLRDGTMATADSEGKIAGAGKDNPIVGRTAFWTDDESCKLNINTASEGVFWDTPSVSAEAETGRINANKTVGASTGFSLASSQPAQGEFQRYPGHPATTCLSPVLGWMWNVVPPTRETALLTRPTGSAPGAGNDYRYFREAIYTLAPFLQYGQGTSAGAIASDNLSPGGTDNPDRHAKKDPRGAEYTDIPYRAAVGTKNLYASVDEYVMGRDRKLNVGFSTGGSGGFKNVTNTVIKDSLQTALPSAVEKLRFFLTANSRAPELNLFGRPRVAVWPVNDTLNLRTTADDLFAFTSTIGGAVGSPRAKGYYFTRRDATSDTIDFTGIPRNPQVMEYLKVLTGGGTGGPSKEIPGFGGTFKAKYSASEGGSSERDQILTEIFDYIRCVNLVDTGTSRGINSYQPYTPFYGTGLAGYGQLTDRSFDWSGQVTPIAIANTKGVGRFITISEAALLFYRSTQTIGGKPVQAMQAVLFFEISTPMPGFPGIRETYYTEVNEDTADKNKKRTPATVKFGSATPVRLNLASSASDPDDSPKPFINMPNISSHEAMDGRSFMPTLGCGTAFLYFPEHTAPTNPSLNPKDPNRNKLATRTVKEFTNKDANSRVYKRGETVKIYPYVSDQIDPGSAPTFELSETHFTVKIYSGESADPADRRGVLVQTVNLMFPLVKSLPVPTGNAPFQGRFTAAATGSKDEGYAFIQAGDVVRSLELVGVTNDVETSLQGSQRGDLRMATRAVLSNAFYRPRGGEAYNGATPQVHGLQYGHGDHMVGYFPPVTNQTSNSVFAVGGTNRWDSATRSKIAILPGGTNGENINGVKRADSLPTDGVTGDYDRGLSKHLDGAFCNKVDEGNVAFAYGDSDNRRLPYFAGRNVEEVGQSFFSPNRQISSPVMFGSLPTGVISGKPWQTLLFRPDREKASAPGHPGAKNFPPDHLLLDLFSMPVIEPYAISEPFSTGGKVNMNYIIAPFGYAKGDSANNFGADNERSYIRRDSALRGVLKSTKLMAVHTTMDQAGHAESPLGVNVLDKSVRADIDPNKTLEQFEDRFKDPQRGLFRSASEICDIDLYPIAGQFLADVGTSSTAWVQFWNSHAQTGDNKRELPYSHIYPRLTTKSNIYTVHMRCQALKKLPGTDAETFDEKKDKVMGEYRGSATIERFIDPNDPALIDYREQDDSVDKYYRFRIIATKQFQVR